MKNPFKQFFKKKEKPIPILKKIEDILANPFVKSDHDIIVNTDIAFREAPSKTLAKIRELFNPVDFDKLEFEEDINDYNLSLLSKEAVAKIIEIIKEDELNRHTKRVTDDDNAKKVVSKDIEENIWTAEHSTFKINPDVERELYKKKIEEELKGKTEKEQLEYFQKTFDDTTEYLKNAKSPEELLETIYGRKAVQDIGKVGINFAEIQRIKQEKELQKNRYILLYETTSIQFPEYSHEEIINFIKENFTI